MTTRQLVGVFSIAIAGLGVFLAALRGEPLSVDSLEGESPVEATETPPTAENEKIAEAVEKFRQRDYDGAMELLKQASAEDDNLPPAEIIMAQLFSQTNQGAAMQQSLENAVVEHPDDPEAYAIMGDLALRQRRITEASLLFQEAENVLAEFQGSEKRKESVQARVQAGLAAVAEARERWDDAQKYLEAWLAIDPDNHVAMQRLARVLFKQKKAKESLEMLRKAAEANENALTPEAHLARFYHEFGDRKNAEIWMKQALKAAPKDVKTHLVAAQWYLETGQLDRAAQLADEALRLDPKSFEAQLLRGVVALFQDDYATAEDYFQQAHLQSPTNFIASNNLALALAEQDDPQKQRRALEYAQANARQNPRMGEALSTYGWVLYKLGKIDEADRVLRAAAGAGNLQADTAYYLAVVANAKGRIDEAIQLLQAALGSETPFPNRPEAEALLKSLQG